MDIMDNNYYNLIANSEKLDALANAFKKAARLCYSGKKLSFDYDILDAAFAIVLPQSYEETLTRLQNEAMNEGDAE